MIRKSPPSSLGAQREANANWGNRTIYQLFIPANMMFSRYLDTTSEIMAQIGNQRNLANHMHNFSQRIRDGITEYGIVNHPKFGQIYAFEVDGFGSRMFLPSVFCSVSRKKS